MWNVSDFYLHYVYAERIFVLKQSKTYLFNSIYCMPTMYQEIFKS